MVYSISLHFIWHTLYKLLTVWLHPSYHGLCLLYGSESVVGSVFVYSHTICNINY